MSERASDGSFFRLSVVQKAVLGGSVVVYIIGAVIAYRFVDGSVAAMLRTLPWSFIAALLALSLVNYAVRGWRWQLMSRHLELGVPRPANTLYYVAGFSLATTPGKAGEAVRLWFLKSGHGVSYSRSLPLMLADRIVDLWAVLILSMAFASSFTRYAWQGLLMSTLVLAVSVPILTPRRLVPLANWLEPRVPRLGGALGRVRSALAAMGDLVSWRTYGYTLVPSIIGWFAEGVALYLILDRFGAQIGLFDAVFIFCFSVIVGAVSMLPGGLGSTEATIVFLLKGLGVDLDVALAATGLVRFTTFWFAVGLGALAMPAAFNLAASHRRKLDRNGADGGTT